MVKGHERKRETYDQWLEKKQAELEKASSNSKQGTVQLSNYADVTEQWLKEATPNSHKILDLQEYSDGVTSYKVDGNKVKLEYSQQEKDVAELIERKFGGELYMVPKVNSPQGISTPDYLFRNDKYDLKTLKKGAGQNTIFNRIKKSTKQANNFVIDLRKTELEEKTVNEQIQKIFARTETQNVKTIITITGEEEIYVITKK